MSNLSFSLIIWQVAVFLFWLLMIFAIIDIIRSKFQKNDKLIWVLVSIFVPFGGAFYFIWGRKSKVL
ncbi:hypothetical protein EGI22_22520 [Lacihabitans sp. LS3-19]|uniref:PLDc N-terminal domain-containing protein n=1 Tax=Lacihabitans sp. LS3-19 TaxID=2487335 RepID=UPI0028875639|nr:hypothetical protein [Lacihabitans sp. LS3-19]